MKSILFTCVLGAPMLLWAQDESEKMEPQFPQQQNADHILRACTSGKLTGVARARHSYCLGFISGVEETIRLFNRAGHSTISVCPPDRVTARQLSDAYVDYAVKHRQELSRPAAEVAFKALGDAFPCPETP